MTTEAAEHSSPRRRETLESVVIRFAGDSGDGMQLVGSQFAQSTALMGNDLATLPNFPAEIRAPAGTTYGVSTFQIHFASSDILTPGDEPDVLVAMNPAALKTSVPDIRQGALLIVNTDAFTAANLQKAGYKTNPLEDGSLGGYQKIEIDITKQTLAAVKGFGLGAKEAQRCKNLWTLGLLCWLFERDRAPTVDWIKHQFEGKSAELAAANIAALNAGHAYGETLELPGGIVSYRVPQAKLAPGQYRNITGNEAAAWGLALGAHLAGLPLFYGSYPITPASTILHTLAKLKNFRVTTFQAEDEIAAICASIGASFAGALGTTGTSGPGIALKSEAMGLAVVTELPLVIVDVQRGGPSTGLPTKTEQSDLMQVLYGRNGDCPVVVLAAATPGECFELCVEAARIATKYMTTVVVLTDGYLANGAEPWKIPDLSSFKPFPVSFRTDPEGFSPFERNETILSRPWARPGTPGLEHRVGGLERDYKTGNVSYDPVNHHKMTKVRAAKIQGIAKDLPEQAVSLGDGSGELAVVGWGSTYGAIAQAVKHVRDDGMKVSHIHLRHMNPFPRNLGALLKGFRKILVPEMNNGMLVHLLRDEFLVPAEGLNKIEGFPFKVLEIESVIRTKLEAGGK